MGPFTDPLAGLPQGNNSQNNNTEPKGLASFFTPIFGAFQNAAVGTITAAGTELQQRQRIRNLMYYGGLGLLALLIFKK